MNIPAPAAPLDVVRDRLRLGEVAEFAADVEIPAAVIIGLATRSADDPDIYHKGVRIAGATIVGPLDLADAILHRPLEFHHCRFTDGVALRDARTRRLVFDRCTISGDVAAPGAHIGGNINLSGSIITGSVILRGATIDGSLVAEGATFDGRGAAALAGDRMTVAGGVFLRQKFVAKGEVRLLGATIGRDLECDGATFDGGGARAMLADNLRVKGSVVLTDGFRARGKITMNATTIDSNLFCFYARFDGMGADALVAEGLSVQRGVFFGFGFFAKGKVDLQGASIGGDLNCREGSFDAGDGTALTLESATVKGSLALSGNFRAIGKIDLSRATVGTLWDDAKSWPGPGDLDLAGFVYGDFDQRAPLGLTERIEWVGRQGASFNLQPYEQLAKVLNEMGRKADSRKVHIAKERVRLLGRRVKWKGAALPNRDPVEVMAHYRRIAMGHVLDWTLGFGHALSRVTIWMAAFIILGWVIFYRAGLEGVMVPSSDRVTLGPAWQQTRTLPAEYPRFNALVYSVDAFFPFVDLHQEAYWLPAMTTVSPATEPGFGRVTAIYLWVHIAAGWILTALGIAGVTGVVKRE
jgi:hypothetical protein